MEFVAGVVVVSDGVGKRGSEILSNFPEFYFSPSAFQ